MDAKLYLFGENLQLYVEKSFVFLKQGSVIRNGIFYPVVMADE